MRILITGAAGRIGSKLTRRLLDEGHEVSGFDQRPATFEHSRLSWILGDLNDRVRAGEAVSGADAVYHLGAFMSWHPDDIDRLFDANVDGTRTILEASASVGVQRFLFASSGEVYPETSPVSLPIDESHSLQPNSPYGLTKLLGEELVRFWGRGHGLPFVILRFAHTQDAAELLDEASFFSGARFFLEPKLRQQRSFGNKAAVDCLLPYADGSSKLVLSCSETGRPYRMHITDTRDMVDGLMLALNHANALGHTFNLGATEPVDFEDLLTNIANRTGLPLIRVNLPGPGMFYETSN